MMFVEYPNDPWRDEAACRNDDEGLFFPDDGDVATISAAKAVCAGCPVRDDCLAYALETNQTEGVWGGYTAQERRRLRRQWMEEIRRAS